MILFYEVDILFYEVDVLFVALKKLIKVLYPKKTMSKYQLY